MHFEPRFIKFYTVDDLLIFIENGEVTLKYLEGIMVERPTAFLQLKKRIEEKEVECWNSVKDSLDGIREFLLKNPDSIYAYEAYDRIKHLEGRERSLREQIEREKDAICDYRKSSLHEQEGDTAENVSASHVCVENKKNTYIPQRVLNRLKGKIDSSETLCNSAVFAPAEIAEGDDMLVQVYIYRDEETDQIVIDSKMSDEDATQRSYTPLNFKIKTGDKITVKLDMHGLSVDGETSKSFIWQNKFTKCCFFVYVPIHHSSLKAKGDVYIYVNGLELGQMSFFSEIKKNPNENISCEVISKLYKKVFISYSHKDENTVKVIVEAYRALGVDYFYDRHSLPPGSLFEKEIYNFIDKCDLFVLCWSKNAEKSEWIKKERIRAICAAVDVPPRLTLYPINIPPFAPPPPDMIQSFHFEDYDRHVDYSSKMGGKMFMKIWNMIKRLSRIMHKDTDIKRNNE